MSVYKLYLGSLASVALDREDFECFCDEIGGLNLVSVSDVLRFKELGHIAMISRNESTEFIFSRFDIVCDQAVVMVRGSVMTIFGPDIELN